MKNYLKIDILRAYVVRQRMVIVRKIFRTFVELFGTDIF